MIISSRPLPMNVIATRSSFLDKNRDVAKHLLEAYSEATYQFMNNRETALAIYKQRLKEKDPAFISGYQSRRGISTSPQVFVSRPRFAFL
jgi:ABC-type nitrate/sulfonate/bicarbonate transport system substrate-binding protein